MQVPFGQVIITQKKICSIGKAMAQSEYVCSVLCVVHGSAIYLVDKY